MANDAGTFDWQKLREEILKLDNPRLFEPVKGLGKSVIPLSRLHRDDPARMLLSGDGRGSARWPTGGKVQTNSKSDPSKALYMGLDLSSLNDLTATVMVVDKQITTTRIVESPYMTRTVADWSDCRSPSRAQRRAKRGFPQRVRYREVPRTDVLVIDGAMHMHPELARQLRAHIGRMSDKLDKEFYTNMIGMKF